MASNTSPPTDRAALAGGRSRLLLLSACLAGAAALLWPSPGSLDLVDVVDLRWWMLALLFWASEALVVHIEFRRQATSFSVSEIPLLFGIAAAAGPVVVLAQVVGTTMGLAVHRRQGPTKLAFNAAQVLLGSVVAVRVAQALVPPSSSVADPAVGVSLLAAAMAGTAVNVASILLAIAVTEAGLERRAAGDAVRFGLSATVAAASAGLAGVVLLDQALWLPLLLIPTIGMMAIAATAYASTRRAHERVSFLYDASRRMAESPELDVGLGHVLGAARGAFRARVAELTLFESDREGDLPLRLTVLDAGDDRQLEPLVDPADVQVVHDLAGQGPTIVRDQAHGPAATWLRDRGMHEALVAPLLVGERPIGLLLVADRLGDVTVLDEDDLALFSTLTEQLSVSLDNGRLERTLAHVTELKEELAHRASHDNLTGLANRAHFQDAVDHGLASEPLGVAVLYLDMDDFKAVNDQFGHDTGDHFLRVVAERINGSLRPGDLAARLGGDEFAVLLHVDDPTADAHAVADRIRVALNEPIRVVEQRLVPRGSIGIALGRRGEERGDLLRRADAAMYAAKRAGGGVVAWSEGLSALPSTDRLTVREEFSRDLEAGRVVTWHQPIVDLATGEVVATEALVRWDHPDRGLLPPDEFLGAAASAHLDRRLTEVVLVSAAAATRHARGSGLAVSVNLSSNEVDEGMSQRLRGVAAGVGLPLKDLIVEVTEHDIVSARTVARAELAELRRHGVRVAIDDFGTGYSSLGYLRDLPADILKLAGELVCDIDVDPRAASLVRGILELAQSLGLATLAKGVERATQLSLLTEWGCAMAQGYHLGPPAADVASSGRHDDLDAAVGLGADRIIELN